MVLGLQNEIGDEVLLAEEVALMLVLLIGDQVVELL